jgi:hypothetical protein
MQKNIDNQATVINSSATVVQNDTLPSITVKSNDKVVVVPASADSASTLFTSKRIEQLATERVEWEQGALRTSNEQLYALLAKCYELYFEMCGSTNAAKSVRTELDDYISKKKYRILSNTHTMTKIVKCVFGDVDRRRISTYSLVLRESLRLNKLVNEVADFISSSGGVEEVRRGKSPTAKTPKQKAELGKQAVSESQLAIVSSDKIAETLDMANVGKDMVAIVTQQADGSLIVRKLISSQTVLNAALSSAYSSNKAELQETAKNKEAANDDQAKDALIKAAAGK